MAIHDLDVEEINDKIYVYLGDANVAVMPDDRVASFASLIMRALHSFGVVTDWQYGMANGCIVITWTAKWPIRVHNFVADKSSLTPENATIHVILKS